MNENARLKIWIIKDCKSVLEIVLEIQKQNETINLFNDQTNVLFNILQHFFEERSSTEEGSTHEL